MLESYCTSKNSPFSRHIFVAVHLQSSLPGPTVNVNPSVTAQCPDEFSEEMEKSCCTQEALLIPKG